MGSAMMSPTFMRGLSEANESWKIICMRRRMRRISTAGRSPSEVPSKTTSPPVGRMRPRIARANVLFPQPLSPTSPTVSPRAMWSDTPSTARNAPTRRRSTVPRSSGKATCRLWTLTSASGRRDASVSRSSPVAGD